MTCLNFAYHKKPHILEKESTNQTDEYFTSVMLHIRKDQMNVLAGYYRKAFMKKLRSYLVDKYPDEYGAIDTENTDQYFEEIMEKSKLYGIKIQRNIAEFGGFCMIYGMNFEKKNEYARTHYILTSNEMAEGTKLLQLRKFFENYDGK